MTSFCAPKMWKGSRCFIVGGGPSLQLEVLPLLKGQKTIVTNNAFLLMPFADVLFFMDVKWATKYRNEIKAFSGLKITISQEGARRTNARLIRKGSQQGLSLNNNRLQTGLNSGHCALNLAFLFGATEIILLGFDMKRTDGHDNWHTDHERSVEDSTYKEYLSNIEGTAPILEQRGISVLNATPGSAIKCFPFININDFLKAPL